MSAIAAVPSSLRSAVKDKSEKPRSAAPVSSKSAPKSSTSKNEVIKPSASTSSSKPSASLKPSTSTPTSAEKKEKEKKKVEEKSEKKLKVEEKKPKEEKKEKKETNTTPRIKYGHTSLSNFGGLKPALVKEGTTKRSIRLDQTFTVRFGSSMRGDDLKSIKTSKSRRASPHPKAEEIIKSKRHLAIPTK